MAAKAKDLQHRVEQLEREVAAIRASFHSKGDRWWVDGAGRFADDPAFAEIARLGRTLRRRQRPTGR